MGRGSGESESHRPQKRCHEVREGRGQIKGILPPFDTPASPATQDKLRRRGAERIPPTSRRSRAPIPAAIELGRRSRGKAQADRGLQAEMVWGPFLWLSAQGTASRPGKQAPKCRSLRHSTKHSFPKSESVECAFHRLAALPQTWARWEISALISLQIQSIFPTDGAQDICDEATARRNRGPDRTLSV